MTDPTDDAQDTPPAKAVRKKKVRQKHNFSAPSQSRAHNFAWLKIHDPERLAEIQRKAWVKNGRPRGVPDGWGGKAKELAAAHVAAKDQAKKMVELMKAKDILPTDDDGRAEAAMLAALEVMYDPGEQRTKLAAARTVLEFTKQKPVARSDMKVSAAEEFLAALAAQDGE